MRNGDLILEVAKNMHTLADSLIAAVNASKKPPDPPAETPVEATTPTRPAKQYTKEEARDILIAVRAKGFNNQIREIIRKHGYEKFTEVKAEDYPAIIKEAEALVNATE
ncbi:MAG: hypothetical protein IJ766_00580 [Clostridia bacterium]|nr:hypothetical protein [Clostridia bacterium]